jgi:hypothetical protein
MNILGRQVLLRRKPVAELSQFASVLPRIRAIREQCDWQPLTNASATEQRSERIGNARRNIIYRPLSCERDLQFGLPSKLKPWRWLMGVVVLCLVALFWISAVTDWNAHYTNYVYRYQLPFAPQFLSEDLALSRAKESLAKVVNEASNWKPVAPAGSAPGLAPDGTRQTYLMRDRGTNLNQGILLFESTRTTNESWLVTLALNGNQLECTVSRKRY